MKLLLTTTLFALCTITPGAQAQTPLGSTLQIEVENHTLYVFDCDHAQLATNPAKLTRGVPKTFESALSIGDIVSINGSPVKGTVFESINTIASAPNAAPGQAIADTGYSGFYTWNLAFLHADGTPLGTVQISGFAGGPPPPGAPKIFQHASYIVTGGTGAFFGVRGYYQATIDANTPVRVTSACEDPALRRSNGGGKLHANLFLVPMESPTILNTPSGPAVLHANNFTFVTAANPAKRGETLSLWAVGLGPTRPGSESGQLFTAEPRQVANSPIEVLFNGKASEALYAGGFPGDSSYQVNFEVPGDTPSGPASLQLSSAWIAGPPVKIFVQ